MTRHMNWFRKHQKIVLATMGIVCMVTFTIGSSALYFNADRPNMRDENPIVVTWTKGKVHQSELNMTRLRHNAARNVLAAIVRETLDRGGTPIVGGRQVRKDQQFFDIGIPLGDNDEVLVETMLMAEEARKHGITVDQDGVK